MGAMASRITSVSIVYSIVWTGVFQRKHQSSASLAFVRGIHRTGEFPSQKASNVSFLMTSSWISLRLLSSDYEKRTFAWNKGVHEILTCHDNGGLLLIKCKIYGMTSILCGSPSDISYISQAFPVWIDNNMSCKVWGEIANPPPNLNSCTV